MREGWKFVFANCEEGIVVEMMDSLQPFTPLPLANNVRVSTICANGARTYTLFISRIQVQLFDFQFLLRQKYMTHIHIQVVKKGEETRLFL